MALTPLPTIKFLGLTVTGDVAGFTCYTTRRRQIVVYPQAPPLTPPTPDQSTMRDKMRNTALIWNNKPASFRSLWNEAARRAKLPMGGFALLFTWYTTRDHAAFATIEAQSSTQLLASINARP